MKSLQKKYRNYLFRKEVPAILLLSILQSVLLFFFSCLTYDNSRIHFENAEEKQIFNLLGLSVITIQSYFFPFITLAITLLILYPLFSYLIISDILTNLFLLRTKGYRKINNDTKWYHLLFSFLILISSVFLYFLEYSIINLIFHTTTPIFIFDPKTLIPSSIYFLYDLLTYRFLLKRKTGNKQLLIHLREKY